MSSSEAAGRLYLARHGEAMSAPNDDGRVLSERGRAEVEKVAAWAAAKEISIAQIRHSTKLRAKQTAEIFAKHLQPAVSPFEVSGLNPNDETVPVAEELDIETENNSLMLVGHLPFLPNLVYLLAGARAAATLEFFPSTLVCLEKKDNTWQLSYVKHASELS